MTIKSLFKYSGEDVFDKIFSEDGASLKFELPENYNDPYELFLTVDFQDSPEKLAYYKELINDIPQLPVTCFSCSPSVTPMWAHYGDTSKGFAIEFDVEKIEEFYGERLFGLDEITYQNSPKEQLSRHLEFAMYRGKPRDVYMLRQAVLYSAYFTKHTCWSYELEYRMLAQVERSSEGLLIDKIPLSCVKSIISGPKSNPNFIEKIQQFADENSIAVFSSNLGKRMGLPYFIKERKSYLFDGASIVEAHNSCLKCKEPVDDGDLCIWCYQNENLQKLAASNNPYRYLSDAGMLESYVESMNNIGNKYNK
jgi:hypothetical protein